MKNEIETGPFNGMGRGSSEKAVDSELKAAKALLKELTAETVEDNEIEIALGW